MILPILEYPDPRLAQTSLPIEAVTDELRTLAANMADTMYNAEGIGLAAPQVGATIRLIIVDITGPEQRSGLMPLINPQLTICPDSEEIEGEEGCLSVPMQYRSKVRRAGKVHLTATDLEGAPIDMEAEGILAVCLQHEVDHLNGVVFLDHLSRLKRTMYDARISKRLRRRTERVF